MRHPTSTSVTPRPERVHQGRAEDRAARRLRRWHPPVATVRLVEFQVAARLAQVRWRYHRPLVAVTCWHGHGTGFQYQLGGSPLPDDGRQRARRWALHRDPAERPGTSRASREPETTDGRGEYHSATVGVVARTGTRGWRPCMPAAPPTRSQLLSRTKELPSPSDRHRRRTPSRLSTEAVGIRRCGSSGTKAARPTPRWARVGELEGR